MRNDVHQISNMLFDFRKERNFSFALEESKMIDALEEWVDSNQYVAEWKSLLVLISDVIEIL